MTTNEGLGLAADIRCDAVKGVVGSDQKGKNGSTDKGVEDFLLLRGF